MLPYLKDSEHHYDPNTDPQQHGYKGLIHFASTTTGNPARRCPFGVSVYFAWKETDIVHNNDPDNGSLLGISEVEENWREGARQPSFRLSL